jgi:hypothetical protein
MYGSNGGNGYEINVAKNGKHFFATDERSITQEWELKEALKVFNEKFPASEGYTISVTKWERIGHVLKP